MKTTPLATDADASQINLYKAVIGLRALIPELEAPILRYFQDAVADRPVHLQNVFDPSHSRQLPRAWLQASAEHRELVDARALLALLEGSEEYRQAAAVIEPRLAAERKDAAAKAAEIEQHHAEIARLTERVAAAEAKALADLASTPEIAKAKAKLAASLAAVGHTAATGPDR